MENDNQQSGTQEINPVERGVRTNEVPMPEQQTGDAPPPANMTEPSSAGTPRDTQESGRDTEEAGKWNGETR